MIVKQFLLTINGDVDRLFNGMGLTTDDQEYIHEAVTAAEEVASDKLPEGFWAKITDTGKEM